MKFRIGHLSTFYHTAILLMTDEKLKEELGAEPQWQLFGTGPSVVKAFEQGELDIAYIGLPPALIGIARGVKIRCIAGGHMEGTVICSKKKYLGYPEIQNLDEILGQFRGKKIGVPGKGSIHDVILLDCLSRYDLREDVKIVNFTWADQVTEAVIREEVAAAFGTPALAATINYYADGRILYPPSLLWPGNPSYGILADTEFIRNSGDLLERFLLAHEKATQLLRDRKRDAAKVISGFLAFAEEELVLDAIKISPKYCAKLNEKYMDSTMDFAQALKTLGYIDQEISSNEIFDTSLIEKIHPENDHYQEGS
jgi:NitT/TauT family transport system substrate-binding protein